MTVVPGPVTGNRLTERRPNLRLRSAFRAGHFELEGHRRRILQGLSLDRLVRSDVANDRVGHATLGGLSVSPADVKTYLLGVIKIAVSRIVGDGDLLDLQRTRDEIGSPGTGHDVDRFTTGIARVTGNRRLMSARCGVDALALSDRAAVERNVP